MKSRVPSGDTAMPRGFCASLSVAVTRSVAVSMTEIEAEPSFGTYANGAATPLVAHASEAATAKCINRDTFAPASNWKPRERSAMLHEFARKPTGAIPMHSSRRCEEGRNRMRALALLAAGCSAVAAAQAPLPIDPIVVTATRTEQRAFDLPVAIDSIDAEQIQRNQLQDNLSESLSRIPGIVVANRWNYAQDLQVS